MQNNPSPLEALKDIRNIMERSSRFISLSGWSGISAGFFALIGAWLAQNRLQFHLQNTFLRTRHINQLVLELLLIGFSVLIAALLSSFYFTYRRSNHQKLPFWNTASRRVALNMAVPLALGGAIILSMIAKGYYDLIGPATLIFYGLALFNASNHTFQEIRYLAYAQLALGVVNLWILPQYSLYCWALGFGWLHIIYGVIMWWKYERSTNPAA
jgi:hypothetical protein